METQEKDRKSWLKAVLSGIGKAFVDIINGNFFYRHNIARYSVHILYGFFLAAVIIWVSMKIDSTMTRVEKNKEVIAEKEVMISMKRYELESLKRRSVISGMLAGMGSEVQEQQQPAKLL